MAEFYAQPYRPDAKGFYFDSEEDFDKKYDAAKRRGIEEFEIQFMDGTDEETTLANALIRAGVIHQGNMDVWYELIEPLEDHEMAALYWYVADAGYSPSTKDDVEDAISKVEDELRVYQGPKEEYVAEFIDDMGGVGQLAKNVQEMYFDYDRFGRDIRSDEVDRAQTDLEDAKEGEDEDEIEQAEENVKRIDETSDEDLGYEYVDSVGFEGLGEHATFYFDEDAFARDMELNSEIAEFDFGGSTWTMTNPLAV